MLKVLMEFRKGILFVRLSGTFSINELEYFRKNVKEVIISSGIRYVVLNVSDLESISQDGVKEIKNLKKILKKTDGKFFLFGGEIKELRSLVNLENELKVFERIII